MIKKFVWVIKNFSSLQEEKCYSAPVLIGDFKWHLVAYPKGYNCDYLTLFLEVANYESLPCGLSLYADYSLTLVNQVSEVYNIKIEGLAWFQRNAPNRSCAYMIHLTDLNYTNSGFLVNDELVIVANVNVDVVEVIGTLNASQVDEPEWTALDYSSSSEINGFRVLDSQINEVKEIFEKHPDVASNFDIKNQDLKNVYMDYLLGLIKTLSKPAKGLTKEDLNEAENTLCDLTKAGFKLDWLRQKLDQALRAFDTSNVLLKWRNLCRKLIN